jgi:hypothetical protein
MGVGDQRHAPAALPPGKTRYPLYRRLGGPQGRSGQVWKISPPPEFDPRTVQPVASRYTDWAIRPTMNMCFKSKHLLRYGCLNLGRTVWKYSLIYLTYVLNIMNILRVFITDIPLSYTSSKRELQLSITTKCIQVYCLLHVSTFVKRCLKSIILMSRL